MKFLSFLIVLLLPFYAHAGFQGINGVTSLGVFNKLTCSTGTSCSKVQDQFVVTSSPSIVGTPLSLTAAASTTAIINVNSDANANNGDNWQIQSLTGANGLGFYNNTSGSQVQKWVITTAGNVTVAGTETVTGKFISTGGIGTGTTLMTRFSSWAPSLITQATSLALAGSASASSATLYMTQMRIPHNMTITGIGVLNAATVGTNKWFVQIFNESGTLLASSAAAGVLTAGASAYQQVALTTPYAATGPQTIWVGLMSNGATDTAYMIPTLGQGFGLAGTVASQTFGTAASVTVPTTFTAGLGPVVYTY